MSFCYTVYSSYPILRHNIFNNNSSEIGIGSLILCLLYICSATFTILSIRKQKMKAASNHHDGMALHVVFPIYLPIMWIAAITDFFVVIAIVFIKFHNESDESKTLLVACVCAIAFGLQHMILEGLAFLLLQHGCGTRAIKLSTIIGILAGIYSFISVLMYYYENLQIIYFCWSTSLLILYSILYVAPSKWLFRRPAIIFYSKFWLLFYLLQTISIGLLILGRFLSSSSQDNDNSGDYTNMAGMCLYHLGAIPLFVICKPLIMYQTLLIESTWWQGLSLYKQNNNSINNINNSSSHIADSSSIILSKGSGYKSKKQYIKHNEEGGEEGEEEESLSPSHHQSSVNFPTDPNNDADSASDNSNTGVSWSKRLKEYILSAISMTSKYHPVQQHPSHRRKSKKPSSARNHPLGHSSGSRQASSDAASSGVSSSFEELKGPLLGVEVGFTEAQQLAKEVDKINSLGMVKLLNFAYLSLDKKGNNLIGAGSFSKVYSGKYRKQPVAIKMLFTQDLNPEVIKRCSNEARILAELAPNPHVVKIFGVAVMPPSVCIVLEICVFGSLADILRGRNAGYGGSYGHSIPSTLPLNLNYADKMYLSLGCAKGLQALHSYSSTLCHRDIKSFNFLIDSQLNAKIADLDLGHEYNNMQPHAFHSSLSSILGGLGNRGGLGLDEENDLEDQSHTLLPNDDTIMASPIANVGGSNMCIFWQSPEVLLGQQYTQRSDIYSLALVIWEILTAAKVTKFVSSNGNDKNSSNNNDSNMVSYGCVPYAECKNQTLVREKIVRGIRPMIPTITFCAGSNSNFGGVSHPTDPLLVELMQRSWHSEPRCRPDIDDLVEGLNRCWRNSLHLIISETEHMVDIEKIANENLKLNEHREESFWGSGTSTTMTGSTSMRSSSIMQLWSSNPVEQHRSSPTITATSDNNQTKNVRNSNTHFPGHNNPRVVRQLPSPEVIASLLLMKSESKWSHLEEEGAFLVLTPSPPFYMLWATKRWTELTGYLINDIIAYEIGSLLGPKVNHSSFQELLQTVGSNGQTNHTVATIYRRDGKPMNLSLHIFPVFHNNLSLSQNRSRRFSKIPPVIDSLNRNTSDNNLDKGILKGHLSFSKCSISSTSSSTSDQALPLKSPGNLFPGVEGDSESVAEDSSTSATWKEVGTPARKKSVSSSSLLALNINPSSNPSQYNNIDPSNAAMFNRKSFSTANCVISDITKLTRNSFSTKNVFTNELCSIPGNYNNIYNNNNISSSIISDDNSSEIINEYSNLSADLVFESLIVEESKKLPVGYIVIQFSILTEK